MAIINKGTAFSNGEQLSASKLNNLVDGATFGADSVDNSSTLLNATGAITVRDSGITAAKLATNAVNTAKILNANVTFAKLADVIDDDTMATATDTTLATSESIKAYADAAPKAQMKVNNVSGATYNGEESVTLPNGLIMKMGVTSGLQTQSPLVVTFAEEFPNGIIIAQATATNTSAGNGSIYDYWYQVVNQSRKESVSLIAQGSSTNPTAHNVNWMVIGY
jgi:hypothetical protein